MSLLRNVVCGVRSLLRKKRIGQELDEELDGFLEMAAEEKIKQGMSRKDALRAVRLEQGTVEITKEVVRAGIWETFVETSWQDLRFAARSLAAQVSGLHRRCRPYARPWNWREHGDFQFDECCFAEEPSYQESDPISSVRRRQVGRNYGRTAGSKLAALLLSVLSPSSAGSQRFLRYDGHFEHVQWAARHNRRECGNGRDLRSIGFRHVLFDARSESDLGPDVHRGG